MLINLKFILLTLGISMPNFRWEIVECDIKLRFHSISLILQSKSAYFFKKYIEKKTHRKKLVIFLSCISSKVFISLE